MSLMYGERERAFLRLQEEIIMESDEQSLFACIKYYRICHVQYPVVLVVL